jgi:hypothetical protein
MSDTHEPTVEEINAELAKSRLEADARMKALQEKLEVAKRAEQEKARRAKEARLEAEAEERAQAQRELEEVREKAEAEAERQDKEVQEKAEAARKVQEAWDRAERDKAERVRRENRKRLYRELIEFKERNAAKEKRKAEEREKLKAGNGMMLATVADLSAMEKARLINAKNAKNRAEGSKPPRARSIKAPATPKPKPTATVNLTRQVRNEEAMRKPGKLGKTRDVAASISVSSPFGLSDLFLGYQLRHVPEPKRPLRLRFSDSVHDMPAKQGSVFVPRREAKAQGRGGQLRGG